MKGSLRILMVEDSEDDALLVVRELRRGGFDAAYERVDTAEAMEAALARGPWDAVIADYSMPRFNGIHALRLVQKSGLDLPFILVSGTVGEEVAVEAMTLGAHDYVLKENLTRLVPAMRRELEEAIVRQERRSAQEDLKKACEELERRVLGRTAELTRANDELRRLATIVESSDDAVIGETLDGIVTSWNRGAERIYGYIAAEAVGKPISILNPPDRPSDTPKLLAQVRRGESVHQYETVRIRKDGEKIHVSLTLSPIRKPSEEIIGIAMIARDITDRIRIEEERIRTSSQLLQGQKLQALGQLAAGVAHEINNPVGYIMSNLTTVAEYLGDLGRLFRGLEGAWNRLGTESDPRRLREEVQKLRAEIDADFLLEDFGKAIEDCRQGAVRIREIVKSLKSFSRVDDRELKMADLNEELENCLRLCWNEIKSKADVRRDYGKLSPIRCFPQQINQVFVNLLVNAVQAIDGKGEISVSTRQDGGHAIVRMRDTGRGMSPEHRGKIFEPFFTTKPIGQGTGLGLHVVHKIVLAHHGRIEVWSEVGRGTEFIIRLPLEGPTPDKTP